MFFLYLPALAATALEAPLVAGKRFLLMSARQSSACFLGEAQGREACDHRVASEHRRSQHLKKKRRFRCLTFGKVVNM